MQTHFDKIRPLAYCSLLSILVHLLLLSSMRMLGSYDFGAPVNQPLAVMVDLATTSMAGMPANRETPRPKDPGAEAPARHKPRPIDEAVHGAASSFEPRRSEPEPVRMTEPVPIATPAPAASPAPQAEEVGAADRNAEPRFIAPHVPRPLALANPTPTMLGTVSGSMSAKYEKLTYLISMHGIPIGNAELESKNENGVTVITLRIKSNAAISSFFPVDDEIETRHIDGKLIITKIRQLEGSFKSDESFTINVMKKRVSWVDFATPRSMTMTVPTYDVLDTLSGIYYLRNLQLQVGKTETLHIYDSESYADVPVEILRREEMRLPNLTKIDTLVVRPLQKTAGIFRRTGDVLIWMTDDDFKVPVRIDTSIALGKVTADLISAESKPHAEEGKELPR